MTPCFRFLIFGLCLLTACAHVADRSLLHEAGNAKAEALLAKGPDVNAKDKDGVTPLHKAVQKGDKAEVEALLAKGADVNARGKNGRTPLHAAAGQGNKDVAELLLS